ncbi:MAG: sel1 repeat family protein [Gallionellaceae bacterium]|nr:sel1 repeat family protein [Gallionellaceae bacterium]
MKIRILILRFAAYLVIAIGFSVSSLNALASGTGTEDLINMAEDGNPMAQRMLGERYAMGLEGAPLDFEKAIFWWNKAAENGDAFAQYNLGVFYKLGQGSMEKDYVQAYMWFSIAEAFAKDTTSGRAAKKKAENEKKSIEPSMTSQQIQKAQSMADIWIMKH